MGYFRNMRDQRRRIKGLVKVKKDSLREKARCWKCNKTGHSSKDCPENTQETATKPSFGARGSGPRFGGGRGRGYFQFGFVEEKANSGVNYNDKLDSMMAPATKHRGL